MRFDKGDCLEHVPEQLLPNGSENWVPACDSHQLTICMSHLRQCKQRVHRHLIWWELGLYGDMDRSCQVTGFGLVGRGGEHG